MICDIPESIEQSFYHGKVYVGLKDPIFQPSDPFHYMTELYKILINQIDHKPFLFLYTDGEPDHRVTYLRVQMALIAIFLALDLDILIALRTPPGHSWKNPVERIMSTLNLCLQCIGLMRNKMDEDFETIINNCNSMDNIRNESKTYPSIIDKLHTSLQPTIGLMEDIIKRLELKEEPFSIFKAATDVEINELWDYIFNIDDSLTQEIRTKKQLKDQVRLINIIHLFYIVINYFSDFIS